MIEKIARRAGGFASTTALRWVGAGREALPDAVAPTPSSSRKVPGRAASIAVAGAVAVLSSDVVRSGLERSLRAVSDALRTESPRRGSSRNGHGSRNGHRNGNGNGNGIGKLTEKTRAELYELAKKADLPGRSTMSKDELAKALKP